MAFRITCLLAWCAVAGAGTLQGSPIQKVIKMLQDNKMKVAADLAVEEKEMSEYSTYCDDQLAAKARAIQNAGRKVDDLTASIDDAVAQTKAASREIATLGTDMASKNRDKEAAQTQRGIERSDFDATEKELVLSIGELEKAIVLTKKATGFLQATGKRPDSKTLIEAVSKLVGKVIDAAWVGEGSARSLKNFLQQQDEAAASAGDLALTAHHGSDDHSSGGMVQVLEDMKTKAEETLSNLRMQEMKNNHNFQMVMASLEGAVKLSESQLSEQKTLTATLAESKGEAGGELAEVKKSKAADQLAQKSLEQECKEAAEAWGDRQKQAKDEMAAIDKAIAILADRVKVLVQHDNDYVSDDEASETPARKSLVSQLKGMSHKFNSYALAELAGAAAQDPFGKVRGLIEDMVAKLVAEANEEATQQAFCTEENAKSKKEKDVKSMRQDKLANQIEVAKASKESLTDNIKDLQGEVAEIDNANTEATELRTEEKASNTKALTDYKNGAEAVEDAIRVLKDYYASVSLVQARSGRQPKLGGASSDASTAIIGLLEHSAEEFTRMALESQADEKDAADSYELEMRENVASKAAKLQEIKASESEIKQLEVALTENGEDLKMVQKELEAVLSYIEKLRPQCETKALTYEEKKARREAEIEGLKEALSILDTAALVQVHKH